MARTPGLRLRIQLCHDSLHTADGWAVDDLVHRKRRHSTWTLQAKHTGETWFDMESPGTPSRWNTLRALRVIDWTERVSG